MYFKDPLKGMWDDGPMIFWWNSNPKLRVTGYGAMGLWHDLENKTALGIIWTYQITSSCRRKNPRIPREAFDLSKRYFLETDFPIPLVGFVGFDEDFVCQRAKALLVALTFSIFLLTLRPRRIRCLCLAKGFGHEREWGADSDSKWARMLSRVLQVWQLSVPSKLKKKCWSPVPYKNEVYLINPW